MNLEKMIFTIISYSGDAKNLFMEAINYAKNNEVVKAESSFKKAEEKLKKAHLKQKKLFELDKAGEKITNSILLTHSQDHLMINSLLKDLARELIDLHKKLNTKKSV